MVSLEKKIIKILYFKGGVPNMDLSYMSHTLFGLKK
jgi:hypothetical protein